MPFPQGVCLHPQGETIPWVVGDPNGELAVTSNRRQPTKQVSWWAGDNRRPIKELYRHLQMVGRHGDLRWAAGDRRAINGLSQPKTG